MRKELIYFIIDKKIVNFRTFLLNHKSNAILNLDAPFPYSIYFCLKAALLELILTGIFWNSDPNTHIWSFLMLIKPRFVALRYYETLFHYIAKKR